MRAARKKLIFLIILFTVGATVSAAAIHFILDRQENGVPSVKTLSFWNKSLKASVKERFIWETPNGIAEFLTAENRRDGFPQTPRASTVTEGERAIVLSALEGIPEEVWGKAESFLAGIVFVEDLGSTGFTDLVFNSRGQPKQAFMVFDRSVFKRRANDWATWKEDSPFSPGNSGRHVAVRISEVGTDGPAGAFQFIFLHELGHVLSLVGEVHPAWEVLKGASSSPVDFLFSSLSWTHDTTTGAVKSIFDEVFPFRGAVKFYRSDGGGIPREKAAEVYEQLSKTSFASLYGATSPADDFAEAFAIFVHTKILKKPYEIAVTENKMKKILFTGCFEEVRCRPKREFLEKFLGLKGL